MINTEKTESSLLVREKGFVFLNLSRVITHQVQTFINILGISTFNLFAFRRTPLII